MRALQLERPASEPDEALVPVDRPALTPGPGELVLAVAASAVCRTDLQIVRGEVTVPRLPIVPGHQVVGRVIGIGEGVSGWAPGDRAGVTWLAGSCGACDYCQSGRENLCRQATFTGRDRDGGFAEQVAVRADVAVRLPPGFDDLEAAPLLCGGVIGHRALRLAGVTRESGPGLRLGLYGFGASASLAIQEARHLGCVIHVATRGSGEQQRALELGATSVGGYHDPPPEPLDAAVTFAPVGAVAISALRALAPGGTVVINAIHLDGIPAFDYALLWEERGLRSVANVTHGDAVEFLALAAEIPIHTRAVTYPLADANRALADLDAGRIGAGAAVLVPGDARGRSPGGSDGA